VALLEQAHRARQTHHPGPHHDHAHGLSLLPKPACG
jgi:hypothetical protein